MVCKLVNVPVSLGQGQLLGSCLRTTFYVLECPTYHFILGLSLLARIEAVVFCSTREMQFRVGPPGKKKLFTIPLIPRSQVKTTPAYQAVSLPHSTSTALETIPEGWEVSLVGEEGSTYVEECLVDVLGMAGLNSEGGIAASLHPLPPDVPLVHPHGQYSDAPCPPDPLTTATNTIV